MAKKNHSNRGRKPRPVTHLHKAGIVYPSAWSKIDVFRDDKGKGLPDWPDWCFMPMAAWHSIVCSELGVSMLGPDQVADVSMLSAIGPWRYTQSIYQIDPDLYSSIIETVPRGAIPTEVLYRMPEWSLYVETPGMKWMEVDVPGFFVHLEWDAQSGGSELRFLLDTFDGFVPLVLHLGQHTITESVDRWLSKSSAQNGFFAELRRKLDIDSGVAATEKLSKSIYPFISLTLYICSNGVDYSTVSAPNRPEKKKTKKGWKLFAANKPRYWMLGKSIGESIRRQSVQQKRRVVQFRLTSDVRTGTDIGWLWRRQGVCFKVYLCNVSRVKR